jgi:hypothetical protein
MTIIKFLLPVFPLAVSLTILSCSNQTKGKDEAAVTQQPVLGKTKDVNSLTYKTIALPKGEINMVKVKEFIKSKYPGYTLIRAVPDPLCQGGDAIDVNIIKSGSPNLSLIFKPDGTFVQQEEDVPISTSTNEIRNALKEKFASYSVNTQIEKLTLDDKTIQYMVDLNKGKTSKEVIFTTTGIVVCETK